MNDYNEVASGEVKWVGGRVSSARVRSGGGRVREMGQLPPPPHHTHCHSHSFIGPGCTYKTQHYGGEEVLTEGREGGKGVLTDGKGGDMEGKRVSMKG